MKKLVVATSNRDKLAEIQSVLGTSIELIAQSEFGIDAAEETGITFIENALIKARQACRRSGLPALADDSGLLVDALAGAPGLISAHYAGIHGDSEGNISRLLHELENVPEQQRTACFYSVIVVLRQASDPQPLIAEGIWHGRILLQPQGSGGFGYDPIFFDPRLNASAAELPPQIKNRTSHRGQALAKLAAVLDKLPDLSAHALSSARNPQ